MNSIFRQDYFKHKNNRVYGALMLKTLPKSWVWVALFTLIAAASVTYLFLTDYTKRVTVSGFLEPDAGVSRTFSFESSLVDKVHVTNGQEVVKGQPLITLLRTSVDHVDSGYYGTVKEKINSDRQSVSRKHSNQEEQLISKAAQINQMLAYSNLDIADLNGKLDIQKLKLASAKSDLEKHEKFFERRLVREAEVVSRRSIYLSIQEAIKTTEIQINKTRKNIESLDFQLKEIQFSINQNAIELAASNNQLDLDEASSDKSFTTTVYAQKSGLVYLNVSKPGAFIKNHQQILSIIPTDSAYLGTLHLSPEHSAFVKSGQKVKLRYDAFPYQKFGVYDAHIKEINKALIYPEGTQSPIGMNQPYYKANIFIKKQQISLNEETIPLESGMKFKATIELETRSLFEWLFEPIYAFKNS